MTATFALPSLVAGRDLADAYIDQLGDIAGGDVVVDARELTSGTSSFAAQLVRRVLVTEQAKELLVVGAPSTFVRHLRDAAIKVNASNQLVTAENMGLANAS